MAEQNSSFQIPWGSLAVVAAFVSSALLVPLAFQPLRPAEKERAQLLNGADLEVDARLWEDPFIAARRHEAERVQRCERDKTLAGTRDCDPALVEARRSPEALRQRLDSDASQSIEEALVMVAMVPGNPFVGAEESRRRTRLALLSGLMAEGYRPESVEHIGLLKLEMPAPRPVQQAARAASASLADRVAGMSDRLLMPYEIFTDRLELRRAPDDPRRPGRMRKYRHVALFWLDEAALPGPKADALALALRAISGPCERAKCPALAIIGPSSSDALQSSLFEMARAASWSEAARSAPRPDKPAAAPMPQAMLEGYERLAHARILNPTATIPEPKLRGPNRGEGVEAYLRRCLARILGPGSAAPTLRYERTIATDEVVLNALASELKLRMPHSTPKRVVLVVESDSLYSQTLATSFEPLLRRHRVPYNGVERHYFFRGVDGITVREGAERNPGSAGAAARPTDAAIAVEWPEARDQLDYLRRLGQELKRSESLADRGPIGAIGIVASDVHDKLLVLQALHELFPDKVFFTTDMDARLVHPRTLPFTRNLVVASSLPLLMPLQGDAHGALDMMRGTPPLRDVYQTATLMAARLASCQECPEVRGLLDTALNSPSVYEIGRRAAVPIAGYEFALREATRSTGGLKLVLGLAVCLMAASILVFPAAPTVRLLRQMHWQGVPQPVPWWEACGFMALYFGFGALALASAVEAANPGRLGLPGSLAFGAAGAALGVGIAAGVLGRYVRQQRRRCNLAFFSGAAVFLAAAAWLWLRDGRGDSAGEPMAWIEGISGWPSHFLNLAALLATVAALDMAWNRRRQAGEQDSRWLGLADFAVFTPQAAASMGWPQRALRWLRTRLEPQWDAGRERMQQEAFQVQWLRYLSLGRGSARVWRIVGAYVLLLVLGSVLFLALAEAELPSVPVRGIDHRTLITLTALAALVALPLLLVAVADASWLLLRFLRVLQVNRSLYPLETRQHFAAQMGDAHAALWAQPLAAHPAQRVALATTTGAAGVGGVAGVAGVASTPATGLSAPGAVPAAAAEGAAAAKAEHPGAPAHSLLDDWIDVQLIARRSAVVAPLVLLPLGVLALIVLARSRLLDNWALNWPIVGAAGLCLALLFGLALLLKQSAEGLRAQALVRMQADLRWLRGAGGGFADLVLPFEKLVEAVQANRSGAFAGLWEQPLLKGLLLPLGGAGGAQLLDYLLLAR